MGEVFQDFLSGSVQQHVDLLMTIVNHCREGIMLTDASKRIVLVNPAFTRITGYTLDEIAGETPKVLRSGMMDEDVYRSIDASIRAEGSWRGEIIDRRKNGELYTQQTSIWVVKDQEGRSASYGAIIEDITDKKHAQEQMNRLAFYDELTGLPNRNLFYDRLRWALDKNRSDTFRLALLFIDLDNFKTVNDALGHCAGDELLRLIADRLDGIVRAQDTLARIGGDEFVLIVENTDDDDLVTVARKIMAAVTRPVFIEGHELTMSASIGIALAPQDSTEPDQLIRFADRAMYRCKEDGKNSFRFYHAAQQEPCYG